MFRRHNPCNICLLHMFALGLERLANWTIGKRVVSSVYLRRRMRRWQGRIRLQTLEQQPVVRLRLPSHQPLWRCRCLSQIPFMSQTYTSSTLLSLPPSRKKKMISLHDMSSKISMVIIEMWMVSVLPRHSRANHTPKVRVCLYASARTPSFLFLFCAVFSPFV